MSTPSLPTLDGVTSVRIFGREPAAWAGVIESALALLFLLGALAWTPIDTPAEVATTMALVTAALTAYTAYATHQVTVAVLVGLLKASVALGAVFGFDVSVEAVASASLFISAVFALVNRQLATPVADDARPPSPGLLGSCT